MLKRKFVLFVQILFLLAAFSAAEATKPRPPLQLALLEMDLSETERRLTLMATANIDSNQVDLAFDLPGNLSLVEGEGKWEGALKKGETKKIEVVVEDLDRLPKKIIGRATLHLKEGATFVQQSSLTLDDPKTGASLPPHSIPPPSVPTPPVKNRQGDEKILEFKGQ
jgi:hypothetical protein